MIEPEFSYGLSLSGHISAHVKPTISFGIEFNKDLIDIDNCAVNLVADGHITFHADSKAGSSGASFCYGIDAGADLYATLEAPSAFSWALPNSPFPIIPIDDVQIYPRGDSPACWAPGSSSKSRRDIEGSRNFSEPALYYSFPEPGTHALSKRAQVYGPLVPEISGLSCPGNIDVGEIPPCPYCTSEASDNGLVARDGETCWYDPDFSGEPCPADGTSAKRSLEKRGSKKKLKWTYNGNKKVMFVVNFPPCGTAVNKASVKKWYGYKSGNVKCDTTISKLSDDKYIDKTNYVSKYTLYPLL